MKDYNGAIDLLLPLVERALDDKQTKGAENSNEKEEEKKGSLKERVQLVVVVSRIWIQAGDLSAAEKLLNRAESLIPSNTIANDDTFWIKAHINHGKALISAIKGDYHVATSLFETLSKQIKTSPTSNHDDDSCSSPSSTLKIAQELNRAMVDFYSGKLDQSIQNLEKVLQLEPALMSTAEAVIFNTSTLYELAAGGEKEVMQRKRDLLSKMAKWVGEPGPAGSSFKL
nr:conserved hypothetical protein [Melanopsichium pennsylvanicum 4]